MTEYVLITDWLGVVRCLAAIQDDGTLQYVHHDDLPPSSRIVRVAAVVSPEQQEGPNG